MASSKEQWLYINAMEHALKVAKTHGIEELEREVRYRASNQVPLNVSRAELIMAAREYSKKELMFIATAMATTLTVHMKMPPTMIMDYLQHFNDLVDVYRTNEEEFEKAQVALDKNYIMTETVKSFLKEDKKDDE